MIYHAMQYTGSAWVICTRAHRGLFMTCAFPNPDRLIACRALLLYGSRLYYEMRLLWMRLRLGQTTRSLPKSRALIFGQECTLSISNALQRDIADSNSSSCNMVHARSWRLVNLGQSSFRTSSELQLLKHKLNVVREIQWLPRDMVSPPKMR